MRPIAAPTRRAPPVISTTFLRHPSLRSRGVKFYLDFTPAPALVFALLRASATACARGAGAQRSAAPAIAEEIARAAGGSASTATWSWRCTSLVLATTPVVQRKLGASGDFVTAPGDVVPVRRGRWHGRLASCCACTGGDSPGAWRRFWPHGRGPVARARRTGHDCPTAISSSKLSAELRARQQERLARLPARSCSPSAVAGPAAGAFQRCDPRQ